jgi:hypothetical protein
LRSRNREPSASILSSLDGRNIGRATFIYDGVGVRTGRIANP